MTLIPFLRAATIIGALSGIPGDFTIRSADSILSSECLPSSQSIPSSIIGSRNFSATLPKSERKISQPLFFARMAVPIPDSPAPSIAICLPFPVNYLTFNVTIVITAKRIPTIQNRDTILASCKPFFW